MTTEKDHPHLEGHRAPTGWELLVRMVGKVAPCAPRAVWRRAGGG